MTDRKPIVLIGNNTVDLPAGDTIGLASGGTGATTAAAALAALGGQAALGYAPARPVTPVAAAGGQTGNIVVGSNSGIGSAGFTATAASFRASVSCSVISTAIGIQTNVFLALVDTTTNKTLATGPTSTVHISIANGHCPVSAVIDTGGLTIGDGYSVIFYAGQVSAGSTGSTQIGYWGIEGANV